MKRTAKNRRRCRNRSFRFESLESRVVLDGQFGAAMVTSGPVLEPFESTDQLRDYLTEAAVAQYRDLFGQPTWRGWWWDAVRTADDLAGPTWDAVLALGNAWGTNVQVDGVDEGDLVKSDGRFIYRLHDNELIIVDVSNPEDLQIASRVVLDDGSFPRELYVEGDRLTLISQRYGMIGLMPALALIDDSIDPAFSPPYRSFEPQIGVSVYDISDPTSPTLLETTEIAGTLIESRAVGSVVYVVTQDWIGLPGPEVHCKGGDGTSDPADTGIGRLFGGLSIRPWMPDIWPGPFDNSRCYYESQEEYLQRVSAISLDDVMPTVRVLDDAGNEVSSGWLANATDIYRVVGDDSTELVSVVSFDVSDSIPGPGDSASILQPVASEVYATQQSLYLASYGWSGDGEATTIVKFELAGTQITPSAIGEVEGRLISQFAMDEYLGYLRVATTMGWGTNSSSQLYVLEANDGHLAVVGQLEENLAVGEQLYAWRFLGDRAFLTTFRQIDPLFGIDLSDPIHPKAVGQLEIPGFSLYFHPVSESLIIGLGRYADPNTGQAENPQLTLFDVSDLTSPQAVATYQFPMDGRGWAFSEAFYDHHAISFFLAEKVLVVPVDMGIWRPWSEDGFGYESKHDFWVFQIDDAAGAEAIQWKGTIAHDSPARRSLEIAGNLYTVANDDIQAHPILDPSTLLDQIVFVESAVDDCFRVAAESQNNVLDVLANDRWSDDAVATIGAVSTPSEGGTVVIADDGRSLIYTPRADFEGIETLEYTVRGETAEVQVTVKRYLPLLHFRLDVIGLDGKPVESLKDGQEFRLNVIVEDLREDATGVFAAYLDIDFDATRAQFSGAIEYGDVFVNGKSGNLDVPGLIDELGAFASLQRVGAGEHLLASIPMRATGSGPLKFAASGADDRPAHDSSVYDINEWVELPSIVFTGDVVSVGESFHNATLATDSNGDGETSPLDVLMVVNFVNEHGAKPVSFVSALRAQAEGESASSTSRYFLDTNDDGYISPLDALQVINQLNADEWIAKGKSFALSMNDSSAIVEPVGSASGEAWDRDPNCPFGLPLSADAPFDALSDAESLDLSADWESLLRDLVSSDPFASTEARDVFFAEC